MELSRSYRRSLACVEGSALRSRHAQCTSGSQPTPFSQPVIVTRVTWTGTKPGGQDADLAWSKVAGFPLGSLAPSPSPNTQVTLQALN